MSGDYRVICLHDNRQECHDSNFVRLLDMCFITQARRIGLVLSFVLLALSVSNQSPTVPAQDASTSTQNPPPTPKSTTAEDRVRYIEWMNQRGTPPKLLRQC
jgi:hypothetical protein